MNKKILGLLASCYLVGCGVHFDHSMPRDQKGVKEFPSELMGKYNFTDSIFGKKPEAPFFNEIYFYNKLTAYDSLNLVSGNLVFSKEMAAYHFNFKAYYNVSKVDTIRLIDRFKNDKRYRDGNYIVFVETMNDTILNLGLKDKLTSLDGKFYFNHFVDKKNWDIYQFEKINNAVSINVTNETDRNQLTDTNRVWKDIFPVVHLSDQQFNDFVMRGGFRGKFGFTKSD